MAKLAQRATVNRVEGGSIASTWSFMFNPREINRSRKTIWDFMNAPGAVGSAAEFVRVDDQMITFEIFLAANRSGLDENQIKVYNKYGIRQEIAEIESWGLPSLEMYIADDTQFISPPTLIFSYGGRSWECVMTNVSIKEYQHDVNLNPTLATASVTLQTKHASFSGIRGEMNSLLTDRMVVGHNGINTALPNF